MLSHSSGWDRLYEKDMEMGWVLIVLLASIQVNVGVKDKRNGVVIDYYVEADSPPNRFVFYYSRNGSEYFPIGIKFNYGQDNPSKGKFYWIFPHSIWRGGYIKVVVYGSGGKVLEKRVIKVDEFVENKASSTRSKVMGEEGQLKSNYNRRDALEDPYAWRMMGYDAQHTGYYPYPLYPPLELKWTYTGLDADFMMLSGCAGNGMLYMPGGTLDENGLRLAQILAMDIESGEIVWKKTLTSNVWSAALSPGDSLLLVGTSIEPSLTQPTFFCLDARSGEILWSKFLYTIGSGLLPVDSFIYVQSVQGFLYAFNLEGEEIWMDTVVSPWIGTGRNPSYYEGKIYFGGENKALLVLDAMMGDTVWVFEAPDEIETDPVISRGRVFFFSQEYPDGILYALDAETGDLLWERHGFISTPRLPITVYQDFLYFGHGYWSSGYGSEVFTKNYCIRASTGKVVWEIEGIEGGRMTRTVITSNSLLWAPNDSYIYVREHTNGSLTYSLSYDEGGYSSWFWPIIYRDYYIDAHGNYLYVYKGSGQPTGEGNILTVVPNPFSEWVTFSINYVGYVSLDIYDLSGRFVRRVWEGVIDGAPYIVSWRGFDSNNRRASSGVYFVILRAGKKAIATKEVVFFKGEGR